MQGEAPKYQPERIESAEFTKSNQKVSRYTDGMYQEVFSPDELPGKATDDLYACT